MNATDCPVQLNTASSSIYNRTFSTYRTSSPRPSPSSSSHPNLFLTFALSRRSEHTQTPGRPALRTSTEIKDDQPETAQKVGEEIKQKTAQASVGEQTMNPSEPAAAVANTSTSTPAEVIQSEVKTERKGLMARMFPKDTSSASVSKLVDLARPEKRSLTFAVGLVSAGSTPHLALQSLIQQPSMFSYLSSWSHLQSPCSSRSPSENSSTSSPPPKKPSSASPSPSPPPA